MSELWRTTAARAGVEGRSWRDLRHFFASLLIRSGESIKSVQSAMGHASAQETLNTYAHLWSDADDRSRAAIDAAFGSAADETRTALGVHPV